MVRTLCSVRFFLLTSLTINTVLLWRVFRISSLDGHSQDSPRIIPSAFVTANQNQILTPMELRQIIFVGGVPRSGTTLIRAMLDAHPEVRCGEETRVIPRLLSMRSRWDHSEKEHQRLLEAGLDGDILDRATRSFISEIIAGHGLPAKYLCNKDPLALNYMTDILRLYPHSKFILMIRDGRAVAYSIVSRNVTISGVNSRDYMSAAKFWNKVMIRMTGDCSMLGKKCMTVYYERLVRDPKESMMEILEFLGVPWNSSVLHHHELINKEVFLSK